MWRGHVSTKAFTAPNPPLPRSIWQEIRKRESLVIPRVRKPKQEILPPASSFLFFAFSPTDTTSALPRPHPFLIPFLIPPSDLLPSRQFRDWLQHWGREGYNEMGRCVCCVFPPPLPPNCLERLWRDVRRKRGSGDGAELTKGVGKSNFRDRFLVTPNCRMSLQREAAGERHEEGGSGERISSPRRVAGWLGASQIELPMKA